MAVQAILNGVDITSITVEGSCTQRLTRPAVATVKVPSKDTTANETARLKILVDGVLDFHGTVEQIEDDGDENTMYTVFTAADPTIIFEARHARDADGDYSKPSFIQTFTTGPQIVQQILQNSIAQAGPMGIVLGSFATGGADLRGTPTNFPMTVADVIVLLSDTGELDVVCTPIDSGGNMGQIDAYNGNYGTDLSGSVVFKYRMGTASNCRSCRRVVDKTEVRNRLRYLLGPRVGTSADPAGDQHWAASIDRTSVGLLPNPPQTTIETARAASETNYYVREMIRVFDALGDNIKTTTAIYPLYLRHWQTEAWLRAKPRTDVHLTPDRGIAPTFKPGDLIGVQAGADFRGGFSGVQRVMERTYRWDSDGVIELGEPVGMAGAAAVITTADHEGI